jgi:hypothetical protein
MFGMLTRRSPYIPTRSNFFGFNPYVNSNYSESFPHFKNDVRYTYSSSKTIENGEVKDSKAKFVFEKDGKQLVEEHINPTENTLSECLERAEKMMNQKLIRTTQDRLIQIKILIQQSMEKIQLNEETDFLETQAKLRQNRDYLFRIQPDGEKMMISIHPDFGNESFEIETIQENTLEHYSESFIESMNDSLKNWGMKMENSEPNLFHIRYE